ncbi:ABC transporter ATP-binding protein/permease [Pendulispora brunnea]|uniref:ABC transporter ATP-binding protein/permease n=1 Tax=Pendulispora brunnea TaxID=2905690 RepID=A0ABZ2JZQ3_9BACT
MSAQATTAVKKPNRAEEKLRAFHEEDAMGKAYDTRLVRRLVPFVRPHVRFLVLSFASLACLTGLNLLKPIVMGDVVRRANASDAQGLVRDGVYLSLLVVGGQLLTLAQLYTMQVTGARAMADLRAHIFLFFQSLQLRFFDRTPVGRLVTRASNDVDAVGELFASGVLNAAGDLISLVGIVAMMLLLDWRLSLIAFAAIPIVGAIVQYVRKRSREAFRDIRAKTARLNAFLNEQVNGISVVQAYSREDATAGEFDAINHAYLDANKRSIYYEAMLDAAIEMVSTLCIASVLWWAGLKRMGDISFPLVVTFTQYIKQFFEPISQLSQRYTVLQSAMAGAERIFQLLDEKDIDGVLSTEAEKAPEGPPDEALALLDVNFEYKPGVPVLKDVSLSAKRGEKIALVGATGAGKSTVASLFLRLYEVNSGFARVFGKDVRTYDRHALREQFSVVPQDVYLFTGTVLSNIAMSDPTPDRAKAEEALRRIGALELFERRNGLDAEVDERGANFSAGERQLIAFARAVYRDAPILVLDEATASVDSDTEARLQVALDAVMADRTALVIAHRLSTIKAVDRIIVFHKGRIAEAGTHDELLARQGVYARLYRMQYAHERVEAGDSLPGGLKEIAAGESPPFSRRSV